MEEEQYLAPRSIRYYTEQATCAFNILSEIYPDILPRTMTRDQVMMLYTYMRDHFYAVKTQRGYLAAVKSLCEFCGNPVFDRVRIPYAADTRPRAVWLTTEQARALLRVPKTPLQSLIIWLELCHGLRRCEIIRLRLCDIHENSIDVTGKGRGGGKLRTIPMHPDMGPVLARWMRTRADIVDMIRRNVPSIPEPDTLLIWGRGRHLCSFSEVKGSGIDDQIKPLSETLGFSFSNHVLRRTFGREMYYSGVSVETIARIMGHQSTMQTLEYIGITSDDMRTAMDSFRLKR